jgi:predicted phosphodiesterase
MSDSENRIDYECPKCGGEMKPSGYAWRARGFRVRNFTCVDDECGYRTVNPVIKDDNLLANVRLAKENQRHRDLARLDNKTFRDLARVENVVEELSKNIIQILKDKKCVKQVITHKKQKTESPYGVIQLSDIHFNEIIDTVENKYDFKVASSRLKEYAREIKKIYKSSDIKEVLLAITGDLLNSDRRMDEKLYASYPRAKACVVGAEILKQFILDLNKEFNLSVACVSGNESRIGDELGFSDLSAVDNYDYTIYNFLKYMLEGRSGVRFMHSGTMEVTVDVNGVNFLLVHGLAFKGSLDKAVQEAIGRYSAIGIQVDYVIFGHIHSAIIGDRYSRSSSLSGSNSYANNALNLGGRASQNIYIVNTNKNVTGIKIDLQNIDVGDFYEYVEYEDDESKENDIKPVLLKMKK